MSESGFKVPKDDKNVHTNVVQQISQLASIIMNVESSQDSNLESFKKTLDELIPKLNSEIDGVHKEATDDVFLSGDSKMVDMLRKLDFIEEQYNGLESTSMKYQSWQEVLQTPQTTFANLEQLREDFKIRADMWRSLKQWEEKTEDWVKQQFKLINAKAISDEADQYAKVAARVDKGLPENPIGNRLKELVGTFRGTMPVVIALRNPDLKENHMQEIIDLLQTDFDQNDENFTLNSLIEMNVVEFQEEIQMISTQASQEASLRSQIAKLDDQWKKIDLITKPYKDSDVNVLDEIDDVFTALDDSLATINTILGSRFVKPLRVEAETWK
jgi:dynein heavy chain